ncbi:hypothetical protein SBP02_11945 [Pseudomonas benzenivorans]|uniref:Uncharacterized protein n=1 Tax=Pseudomonas benzenivorans TaxID=556533 RepID=A0ABZ0PQT4_9PSED|nr:hypothetical protein [Pseudomonas benzenivorans]WPC03497.1 hypothetical protein SBP02_11945 [Pseudomonas benzenivorans]
MDLGIPLSTNETNPIKYIYEYVKASDSVGAIYNAATQMSEPFALEQDEYFSFFVQACDDFISLFPGLEFPEPRRFLRFEYVLVDPLAKEYINNPSKKHLEKYLEHKEVLTQQAETLLSDLGIKDLADDVDSEIGVFMDIINTGITENDLRAKLGEIYLHNPEKDHLRKYAKAELMKDLGM